MEEFEFKKITKIKGLPYSFKTFKSSEVEQFLPQFSLKKEVVNYPLHHLNYKIEDDDENPKVYLLENGMVLVMAKYTSTLFPSLKDLENLIEAKKIGRKKEKENPIFYTKLLDTNDPRERILLRGNNEEFTYHQYSLKTYQSFLDNFSIQQTTELKWKSDTKLTGKNDRVVFWRKGISHLFLVFENEATFLSWHNRFNEKDSSGRIWKGRNPYQEKILEHKEELFQKLADFLQLKRSDIQPIKGKYHHNIHKAISELIFVDYTVNHLFLPLVIYLGELQKDMYGGEWHLVFNESIKTWIPMIQFKDHNYDIGKYILWDLLDPDNKDFPALASVCWSGKVRAPE